LLLLLKIPFVALMLLLLALFHTLKYVLVLPVLVRFSERFIDLVLVKVIMQAFALMRW